jgi:hypothetical protein
MSSNIYKCQWLNKAIIINILAMRTITFFIKVSKDKRQEIKSTKFNVGKYWM